MTGPPLKPLRAFEAAARTGSFAAAARELKVTSAAVSQQVKVLERYWGRTLFLRQGNRLSLTEAGLTAYPPLANALTAIGDLSERMQGISRRARFVLSALPSVAETWLPLRLAAWIGDGGDRQVDIRIEDDPIDFNRDRVHMRIFHGHSLYADYCTEVLFHDRIIAIATPAIIACHGASVTGARYGMIATVDDAGTIQEFIAPGLSADERRHMAEWPHGYRFFEHLRDLPGALRLANLPAYLRSLGYAEELTLSKTLQATPMRHRGVHVGSFFLGEKAGGQEFTGEDEEVLVLFASQAATAIANARTHRAEQRARADLEALVDTSPVACRIQQPLDPAGVAPQPRRIGRASCCSTGSVANLT